MKSIVEKHPLAIRWFHWVNFPVLGVMIWSGLLIYWANDIYRIGWSNTTVLKFFPDSFYKALNVPFNLSKGMAFHFLFMWIFFVNGFLYVVYTIFSGEWRYLLPDRHSLRESILVVLHDLHIIKIAPPQDKYNAAQRIAYSGVILMGLGSLVTGLAVYKPVQFGWLCTGLGGYEAARIEHFLLTIGYVLFFVVHVVQVILAGWNNFRAMVAGFEVVNVPEPVLAVIAAEEEITEPVTQTDVAEPEPVETIEPEPKREEVTHEEEQNIVEPESTPQAEVPEIDETPIPEEEEIKDVPKIEKDERSE
jgi:thiosulfate reductase cytochrome b subunit